MTFNLSTQNAASVLRIEGELDVMSSLELRPTITRISEEQPSRVLVDLSRLRLIDGSGVGTIISLFKKVRAYEGTLEVSGVCDQPLAIFQLLKLDRVMMAEAPTSAGSADTLAASVAS